MDKQTTADGLRALADFLDSCTGPAAVLNRNQVNLNFFDLGGFNTEEARVLASVAKQMRTFDKSYSDSLMTLKKDFGLVSAHVVAMREAVCKRVVVGTEEVPEQIIPAKEAQVIPAHTIEKVEWDCTPSLLSPEFASLESESA